MGVHTPDFYCPIIKTNPLTREIRPILHLTFTKKEKKLINN